MLCMYVYIDSEYVMTYWKVWVGTMVWEAGMIIAIGK